jgi:4-amino-4-deoxy-L-arabinose transferase-like glycosyltransferase
MLATAKLLSHRRLGLWILVIFASLLILIGHATINVIDRDEARFAQASKQMVETADIITVKFQDELRAKKPIGIYWLQSASAALFGSEDISSYRLPSLVGYIVSLVLCYLFVRNLWPDSRHLQQLVSSSLLASCFIILAEAHIAKTDSLLLSLIMTQQFSLWLFYKNRHFDKHLNKHLLNNSSGRVWFWVSMAFAILVKGPIAPFLALTTLLGLVIIERELRWIRELRFVSGLLIIGIICLPWFLAVSIATDGSFLAQAVTKDLLPKLASGQESHGAPPGTYVLTILLLMFPVSIFLGSFSRTNAQFWRSDATKFCFVWFVGYWFVIELIPTKLPHYILPILPALVMLTGRAVFLPVSLLKWRRIIEVIIFVISALSGVLLLSAGLWGAAKLGAENGGFAFAFVLFALLLIFGIFAFGFKWIRDDSTQIIKRGQVVLVASILGIAFNCVLFSGIIGNLKSIHIASLIEQELEALPIDANIIALAGYHEPSAVFTLGEEILLLSANEAALLLAEAPEATIIVESRHLKQFQTAALMLDIPTHQLSKVDGFNISKGQFVELYFISSIKFDDKSLNG